MNHKCDRRLHDRVKLKASSFFAEIRSCNLSNFMLLFFLKVRKLEKRAVESSNRQSFRTKYKWGEIYLNGALTKKGAAKIKKKTRWEVWATADFFRCESEPVYSFFFFKTTSPCALGTGNAEIVPLFHSRTTQTTSFELSLFSQICWESSCIDAPATVVASIKKALWG